MSDGVKSLVQMLADLSPRDTLQTQASRLGHLFDGEAEVGEGALANLQAFAEQHGCKADYEAPSGMVRFEKAPPAVHGNGAGNVGNG